MMKNIMYGNSPQQCRVLADGTKVCGVQQIAYNKIKTSNNDPTITKKSQYSYNIKR